MAKYGTARLLDQSGAGYGQAAQVSGQRVFVIVNPTSGRGRAKRLWPKVEEALAASLAPADLDKAFTTGTGEATILAQQAVAAGYAIIAVLGGDGTLHETVNGLVQAGAAGGPGALLVLPAGTGNDFSRTLGIPLDPIQVAASLSSARYEQVDLGLAGSRYFVNVAGIGFDAEVAAEVNRGGKIGGGMLPYMGAMLKKLFTYKNAPLQIKLDDRVLNRQSLLVAVGVAQYYGGGMQILPEASLQDGLLDVCIAGDLSRAAILGLFPRIFSGGHVHHPLVEITRSVGVRVAGPENLHVHADGEIVGRLPMEFRCLPAALRLLLPAAAPKLSAVAQSP